MTMRLELSVRPPCEDWVCRFMVVGMRVSEVVVMGIVVAMPLMVVTMSVVNVRMEREKEVDRLGETEEPGSEVAGEGDEVEGVEEMAAEDEAVAGLVLELRLELVVGGIDAEVVGRTLDNDKVILFCVEAVMEELSANCRLSTSLLACISTGSATTSHIESHIDRTTPRTENIVLILSTQKR
jgi:hypothetical protein